MSTPNPLELSPDPLTAKEVATLQSLFLKATGQALLAPVADKPLNWVTEFNYACGLITRRALAAAKLTGDQRLISNLQSVAPSMSVNSASNASLKG